MPINQRGNSWQASITKNGRRYRKDCVTHAEAYQWEAEAKAALARGESPDMGQGAGVSGGMTMDELFTYTMRNRWKGKSGSLARNGQTCVTTLGPLVPVSKVDTLAIDRCVQIWLEKGNTGSTVNRKLAALSTMLTEASRLGIIPAKPYLRRQKENEHRIRWFSDAEEASIVSYFQHIGKPEIAEICLVAVDTGLRKGTILKLEASDIELGKGGQKSWIRLAGAKMKNGKAHDVPLTKRAEGILRARCVNDGYLFNTAYDSLSHYWKGVRSYLNKDDDEQFVFHVFRHTFCSRLVQRGIPIEVVQKLAGHETLQMTMRYAKLAPRNLTTAIDVLEVV
jgi:integrase